MISMLVISPSNAAKAGRVRSRLGARRATPCMSVKKLKLFHAEGETALTPAISGGSVEFSTRGSAVKTKNVVFVMEGALQENGPPL